MNKLENKFLIGQRFLFDPYDNSLIDQLENDELTRLGSNESRALSLLIEDPGAIISRSRLHDFVWREQGFEVDDSSLTQAISTLRKALKDSTKSPEFIKTVPKRGYQMIATVVQQSTPAATDTEIGPQDEYTPDNKQPEAEPCHTSEAEPTATAPVTPTPTGRPKVSPKAPSSLSAMLNGIALILALVIPLSVNFMMPKTSQAFTQLATIEGVPVEIPQSHPDVFQWENLVSQCIHSYIQNHPNEKRPVKVIATGGQNSQLWLNYVHSAAAPNENVTLRLLTSDKDHTELCQ
ncbi:transcriptional regulator [Photobacterium aquae]|uniref:Transcriptional regulator n=1 Tax=Photobacterium aquae TaxID=1195763 RepID=A0A0J1HC57_9GAMM|nr:transcriptional regulator [Photobacterium aquae]KLV09201.1 transcriptional regulator [Photobacterium aquae]